MGASPGGAVFICSCVNMHNVDNARLRWRARFPGTPVSIRWVGRVHMNGRLERAARMLHTSFTAPGVVRKVVRFQTRLA